MNLRRLTAVLAVSCLAGAALFLVTAPASALPFLDVARPLFATALQDPTMVVALSVVGLMGRTEDVSNYLPGRRGLIAVRADAGAGIGEIKALIEGINRAHAEFKAEHKKEMDDLKKGMGDVVQSEKVERINGELSKMQKAIDDLNAMLAAAKVGGGGGDPSDPVRAEHAKAFERFFRRGVDADLRDLEVKAKLTSGSEPDGGYVVPIEMATTIDRVLAAVSTVRSLSTVMQLSAPTYKKMVNMGGAAHGWVGEEEARPETSTPVLRALEFNVMEIYAQPAATQATLDDASINIEQWLADEVSQTFADQEGAAFVSGNGVRRPRGILAYPTVLNANYAWGSLGYVKTGAAADFAASAPADTFLDLVYSLKAGYRRNASFLMNDVIVARLRKFKDGQSNYLWQPSMTIGEPATFAGYAVNTDDNMPNVAANAFPVAFGDFRRGYLILDRIGIRVLRDPYTSKGNVLFYTTKRVGGGVQNFEAIKLMKCEA
jgi:HK97 family phage major capsid protein